jgi:hypothetical protein
VTRPSRRLLSCGLAALALLAAGCGAEHDPNRVGETEGIYVEVDELSYQIQMSRILEPSSREDAAYLRGLGEGVGTGPEEVWFGIFLRVENETEETHEAAERFHIVDTTEKEYRPVPLDVQANPFVYQPETVPPGVIVPEPDTAAFNGPIQGELILFKVGVASLYNRPLEFVIESAEGGDNAMVAIDV